MDRVRGFGGVVWLGGMAGLLVRCVRDDLVFFAFALECLKLVSRELGCFVLVLASLVLTVTGSVVGKSIDSEGERCLLGGAAARR